MPPRLNFSSAARTSSTLFGRTMLLTSFISCLPGHRGVQDALEALHQSRLLRLDELAARPGDVQHVNRLASLRADQRQVQVALELRDDAADPVEQPRRIVGDDLEDGV